MSSVDDRIVNMQFNNKQFTQGATESQRSLEGLDRTIAGVGKNGGMSALGSTVEGVAGKFSAMKVAGITAVATIASKATTAGLNLAKSFTIAPIMDGFHEYETNLNSIQTIMANTGAKINTVNKYLNNLNHYSDQTIYNFGQMAENIGRFTAAGVKLPDATDAIKGMANTAALTGANTMQLNSAMYQMSQALSTGTIRLMDWNSLSNANMGTKNIQEAIKATARTMADGGAAMDTAVKKAGNFRDSLQAGWLSSETFTKTMKVMAGTTTKSGKAIAFTVAQLKGMGYSEEAAKKLHTLSQASIDSATKIKTFTQLLDVVKESVGSGWAKIFQDLFGNFNEASSLWTKVGGNITNVVSNIFGSVDKMLIGWRKLGGYQDLWAGFGNIFKAIGNILHPFVAAFKSILPATGQAGSGLAKASSGFESVTHWIEVATRGFNVLTPVLTFVFGSFKMGASAIGAVFHAMAPLVPLIEKLGSAVAGLAQNGEDIASGLLGGLLKGLNANAIEGAVSKWALGIVDWIKAALGIHSPATTMIPVGINIAEGIAVGIGQGIKAVAKAMATMAVAIFHGAGNIGGFLKKIAPSIGTAISSVFGEVEKLFKGFDAMDWAGLFNAILTGSMLMMTKKVMEFVDTWKGFGNNLQDVFDGVGDSLKAWQSSLKAKMILEIAIAIGILAVSLAILAALDPKKLAIGLGAITILLGDLSGTLLALSKISTDKQMAILATSMALISAAMLGFAIAVTILGQQDPKNVAQGIGAIALMLGILVGAMLGFSKIQGSVAGMAGSMLVIAFAMNVLAAAVLAFGMMDVATLAKGLGSIAIALGLFVAAMLGMDMMQGSTKGLAASILVMSTAMVILATAVAMFGNMDMETLAKGLGSVAIGLGLMVAALLVLGTGGPATMVAAGSILVMSAALIALATAVAMFGNMDMGTLAKGFGAVAVGLGLLLLAAAGAEVVAVGLEVLGSAILMIGAGMALAGVGMAAFGAGFAVLAATGTAGIAVVVAAIHALLALLPAIAVQVAAAFIAFIKVIANASTEIRKQFDKIFKNMIGVITDNIPVIVDLIVKLVKGMLDAADRLIPEFRKTLDIFINNGIAVIVNAVPRFVNGGMKMILGVLTGMENKLPKIIDKGTDLIIKFIEGMGNATSRIVDAAGRTVLKTLTAIDDSVQKYSGPIGAEGRQIAYHLVDGLTGGLLSYGIEKVQGAVESLSNHIPGWARKMLGIASPAKVMIPIGYHIGTGVARGIARSHKVVIQSVWAMADIIISEGNKAVLRAAKAATSVQRKAYVLQARAEIAADKAKEAARYAKQHKKNKEAKKRAHALQKQANEVRKQADKAQRAADRADQHVQNVREFQNADLHGKGDIKDNRAVDLADKSAKVLAKANAEAARARELMKTNRKAGRAMLQQAHRDAKEAAKLEKRAREAHKAAQGYYAQEVNDRIKQMRDASNAEKKAKEEQAKYDAASAQGKSQILKDRATRDQALADAANKKAAKLVSEAKKLAKTDAAKAMKLLDRADAETQKAKDAADQAKQELDQAQQVLQSGSGSIGGPVSSSIIPTQDMLEAAASAVARYTASLQEAETLAAAAQGPVQFVQNNYSPEALTPSEIYRQNKNLLAAAQIKMGAVTSP